MHVCFDVVPNGRIRDQEIRRKTRPIDITRRINMSKWQRVGHVALRTDDRWVRKALGWRSRTGHSVGRPPYSKKKEKRKKKRLKDSIIFQFSMFCWSFLNRLHFGLEFRLESWTDETLAMDRAKWKAGGGRGLN
ncbi:hypothetical protein EVAR_68747_1 [Eumeta japonica]|uniref:Uncharacterized protein n=1 Tax=Eumeta variegata TaxID=151549 RepID=A0A4C1ZKX4_EUMVA|nr:hypothetical protein EVAR_68747_1 [Eumeta japonica]